VSLNATDFVPLGPIRSADLRQFIDLFTGIMTDQPVTFKNTLTVGGSQGATTTPLKIFGATGQTSNLVDLYPDPTSLNPTFGFAALGGFAWGPGGAGLQDTFLSRIARQNGHTSDTAGLLVDPRLEVHGTVQILGPLVYENGAQILPEPSTANTLRISLDLVVERTIFVGTDKVHTIREATAAHGLAMGPKVLIHGMDAQATGLTFANTYLQVRTDDLSGTAGASVTGTNVTAFAGNWLQLNTRFTRISAGAWDRVAAVLSYDVDNSQTAGGQIQMANQRVSIGGPIDPTGANLQVIGSARVTSNLTAQYLFTTDGANGIVQATTGNLYVRNAGGNQYVVMDTGLGLVVSAGGINASAGPISSGPAVSGNAGDLSANRNNGTGYVWLANATHYIGFDGTQYVLPTSDLIINGLFALRGAHPGQSKKLDHGLVSSGSFGPGAIGVNVAYSSGVSFATAPNVFVSIADVSGGGGNLAQVEVGRSAITTTGFQMTFNNQTGSTQTIFASWIAIGD